MKTLKYEWSASSFNDSILPMEGSLTLQATETDCPESITVRGAIKDLDKFGSLNNSPGFFRKYDVLLAYKSLSIDGINMQDVFKDFTVTCSYPQRLWGSIF